MSEGADDLRRSHKPSRPLRRISRRHFLDRIGGRDRGKLINTIVLPGYEDAVEGDRHLINEGRAERSGNEFRINGRVYIDKGGTGTFYPVLGEGMVTVDGGTYRCLVLIARYNGPTEAALREIRSIPTLDDRQLERALELWNLRSQ